MNLEELQKLIQVFEASTLSELEIEEGGRRVRLRGPQPVSVQAGAVPPALPKAEPEKLPEMHGKEGKSFEGEGLATIDSPMVGTFYTAPAPGEAPFLLPGDTVEPGQTVCVVEAMKIMNEVPAKVAAIIEKVLVENGEAVEYGQPLFAIRPLA